MVVMSASRGTFLSVSGLSVSIDVTISGRQAFLEPETTISPLRARPPLILMRSMSVSSDLGQSDAALALVLAGLVAVGDLAGLVALQEQELRGALVGVDLRRQRRGVGELERHMALPFGLEGRHVHDDAAPRVGR